ncbi:unnamed protein product, partial [Ixodes hexagonus]
QDNRATWGTIPQAAAACYPYDPALAAYSPYGDRYGAMDSAARRKNATRETTNTLKAWLYEHRKNPYPTKGEKIMLAIITKMTLTQAALYFFSLVQVSTWFANARRRLKKENKMTWEPRNKNNESGDDKADGATSDTDNDCGDKADSDAPRDVKPGTIYMHKLESSKIISCHQNQTKPSAPEGGPVPPGQYALTPRWCGVGSRPKIWSLAQTATSDSPPGLRRSP